MKEVQIDTLVGPTHYYGGLSYGNVASMTSRMQPSNPKLAALQGLEKMKLVHDLGVVQLILPPHHRPAIETLKNAGFTGSEQQILEQAYRDAPQLFIQCSSQSAMWTANAATVSSSADTKDGKVHLSVANLLSNLHRSLEVPTTLAYLKKIFNDGRYFVVHDPLPSALEFADEGAANHTRFTTGLNLFVYGKSQESTKYPARQTLLAQEAIARRHGLNNTIFLQQNPKVIDQGVFHNDVIAVGHEDLYFYHEEAYTTFKELPDINHVCIKTKDLSVEEAVKTYLFNSQLLTLPDGTHIIICPSEVQEHPRARKIIEERLPQYKAYYLPLNQSMKNGGGPACLRLRLPLTDKELTTVAPTAFFTQPTYTKLKTIIEQHYPETYTPEKLLDKDFRKSCHDAVTKIQQVLS